MLKQTETTVQLQRLSAHHFFPSLLQARRSLVHLVSRLLVGRIAATRSKFFVLCFREHGWQNGERHLQEPWLRHPDEEYAI